EFQPGPIGAADAKGRTCGEPRFGRVPEACRLGPKPYLALRLCCRRRHEKVMTKRPRVLFLCTGNYYRSRYAEELFNHFAKIEGLDWRAFSRGATERGSPGNMGPMSRFARER